MFDLLKSDWDKVFNLFLLPLSICLLPGGSPERPGAGGNSLGAGRRARPLGGGEAEDGFS